MFGHAHTCIQALTRTHFLNVGSNISIHEFKATCKCIKNLDTNILTPTHKQKYTHSHFYAY